MKTLAFIVLFFTICITLQAQNGFTQADRERMLRLEIQMSEGFKRIDQRMDMMQKQIDENRLEIADFRSSSTILIVTLFSLLFTGYIALFGYIYWDRKTAVKNVETEQIEMKVELSKQKEKIHLYERIFKEVSMGKPLTPELLHQYGI